MGCQRTAGQVLNRKRGINDTLTFFDGQNIHDIFHQYSVAILVSAYQHYIPCSRARTHTDAYMVISEESNLIQEQIHQTVIEAMQNGIQRYSNSTMVPDKSGNLTDDDFNEWLCQNEFMKPPSKQVVNSVIAEFID